MIKKRLVRKYSRRNNFFAGLPARVGGLVMLIVLLVSLMENVRLARGQSTMTPVRQASLDRLTSTLHIGTEFFLNRSATQDSINMHFRLMHENGLTIARIFLIWDDIERVPGVWNFERYDWIYDAAAKNKVQIAATLCAEDPPGWANETTFYHQRANLDDPQVRSRAAIYIDKVVHHYKDHPAQGPWLLMNEPSKYHADAPTFRVSSLDRKKPRV